jgi:hypothetical protein
MRQLQRIGLMALVFAAIAVSSTPAWALKYGGGDEHAFTEDFRIVECTFNNIGSNAFFNLIPDYRLILAGEEDKEDVVLQITVLSDIEMVDGVATRVVEEREWHDGELAEVSRNYFAICQETGNAFYFGEYSVEYPSLDIEGSWRAGENDAVAGVIMPGSFMLGARYYQEIAPDVALDRAENIAMGEEVETPAGIFTDTAMTEETSPIEPNSKEEKVYAAGIGIIQDGTLLLTCYGDVLDCPSPY